MSLLAITSDGRLVIEFAGRKLDVLGITTFGTALLFRTAEVA